MDERGSNGKISVKNVILDKKMTTELKYVSEDIYAKKVFNSFLSTSIVVQRECNESDGLPC